MISINLITFLITEKDNTRKKLRSEINIFKYYSLIPVKEKAVKSWQNFQKPKIGYLTKEYA